MTSGGGNPPRALKTPLDMLGRVGGRVDTPMCWHMYPRGPHLPYVVLCNGPATLMGSASRIREPSRGPEQAVGPYSEEINQTLDTQS
jgi:hypothetical protein